MASDNVNLLSYATNLASAASYTTEKVLLSQYVSMNILIAADQNITAVLQFSSDGANWDYSVTKNYSAGENTYFTHPVVAKWTRLQITNIGPAPTTYLRVRVYGTPSNSSLNAIISKVGNVNPQVDIGNFPSSVFGEGLVVENMPWVQYIYNHMTDGNIFPPTYAIPYDSIDSFSSDNSGLVQQLESSLRFGNSMNQGAYATMWGDYLRYKAGQGVCGRFTFGFLQQTKSVGTAPTSQWIGIGNLDVAFEPYDFMGFGFDSSYGDWNADGYDNWGIVYIQRGVKTFIHHSLFNVDKCDGNYILPAINVNYMQLGQVRFAYLGFGSLEWSLENPNTGKWQVVHRISRTNSVTSGTNFADPSMSLIIHQNRDGGTPSSNEEYISTASFGLFLEGHGHDVGITNQIGYYGFTSLLASGVPPVLSDSYNNVISVRNDPTWYTANNHTPIDVIRMSVTVTGTKEIVVILFQNPTHTGPAWVNSYSNHSPVSYSSTGSIQNGIPILIETLQKDSSVRIDLTNLHIHLNPNESVGIGAWSSANFDIYASLSCGNH